MLRRGSRRSRAEKRFEEEILTQREGKRTLQSEVNDLKKTRKEESNVLWEENRNMKDELRDLKEAKTRVGQDRKELTKCLDRKGELESEVRELKSSLEKLKCEYVQLMDSKEEHHWIGEDEDDYEAWQEEYRTAYETPEKAEREKMKNKVGKL